MDNLEKPSQSDAKDKTPRKKGLVPKDVLQKHLKYFQTQYPKCFTIPPSPLAINIHLELRNREKDNMSNNLINKLLGFYTRSPKYKKTLTVGNKRLDLDGNVTGTIKEEDLQQ